MLANILGVDEKTPYRYRSASSWRAAGDFGGIPQLRKLLAHSEARQLGLTARHLVCGATEDEVAAILRAREDGVAA